VLFVLPALIFICIFMYQPAISVVYHSFFRWDGFGIRQFIGVANYSHMVRDPNMAIATRNLGYFFAGWMLQRIAPFAVAELIFNLKNVRAQYWYRTLFVLPMVVPFLVSVMIWKFIYNPMPQIGMLNRLLGSVGLEQFQQLWLADRHLVIPSLLFQGFPWISGFVFMVFYAGLQQMPDEILDAALVDGCSVWRRILLIDVPLMATAIRLIAIQTLIGTLQEFAFVLLMTEGGPAKASLVPGLYMYMAAFRGGEMGFGSAIGVTIFVAILILTLLTFRYTSSPFERAKGKGA
jgi:raffinose/stachyose/melibiose transport system permease protein